MSFSKEMFDRSVDSEISEEDVDERVTLVSTDGELSTFDGSYGLESSNVSQERMENKSCFNRDYCEEISSDYSVSARSEQDVYQGIQFVSTDGLTSSLESLSEPEASNICRHQAANNCKGNSYPKKTKYRKMVHSSSLDNCLTYILNKNDNAETVFVGSSNVCENLDLLGVVNKNTTETDITETHDPTTEYAIRTYGLNEFDSRTENVNNCPFKQLNNTKNNKYNADFESKLDQLMFLPSGITVRKMLSMVESMCLRHKLTKKAVSDIVEFAKILAGPQFNSVKISRHLLNKFCAPKDELKLYTFYCPECAHTVKEFVTKKELSSSSTKVKEQNKIACPNCPHKKYKISTANKFHFVNTDIKFQLESVLRDPKLLHEVVENSKYARSQKEKNIVKIRDYYDSELYRNNPFIHDSEFADCIILTGTVNIDGAKVRDRAKLNNWPIQLNIHELPVEQRFKINFLAASWYTKEPDCKLMQTYTQMFIKSIEHLFTEGFYVLYQGKPRRVLFLPIFIGVDAKARAPLAFRLNVTGYCSCHWCYHRGLHKHGAVRFPLQYDAGPLVYAQRTHLDTLKDGRDALKMQKQMSDPNLHVNGVKGICAFSKLPGFDVVWGFPAEYLHSCCLGIAKQLNKAFITPKEPYALKKKERESISEKLLKIHPLAEMYRKPNSLEDLSVWNAADWLYWAIYYAIPCYKEYLHPKNLKCLVLFCKILYGLLDENIQSTTLDIIDEEITMFQRLWQKDHGEEGMTSNVHSATHLTESVRKTGPLWLTSAFGSESFQSRLKHNVHSAKGVAGRMIDYILEYFEQRNKLEFANSTDNTNLCSKFCSDLIYNQKSINENKLEFADGAFIFCSGKNVSANRFLRCSYKNNILHSKFYKSTIFDNTIIQLEDGRLGEIEYFFIKEKRVYMKMQEFLVEKFEYDGLLLEHLLIVTNKVESFEAPVTLLKTKLLHVNLSEQEEWVIIPRLLKDVK